MLNTTLHRLRCPAIAASDSTCGGVLEVRAERTIRGERPEVFEITSGRLACGTCGRTYPILAGVAILVDDVPGYVAAHVKGLARAVPEKEIPDEYLEIFLEAREEIQAEHIEEDLEAERVVALYLMNHYLRVKNGGGAPWWKPESASGSPLIEALVEEHWDRGPFARIREWVDEMRAARPVGDVVELGCGVGGLAGELSPMYGSYLGVDSSFASIALARHLALGVPYSERIRIPSDLLQGPVSRDVCIAPAGAFDGTVDFVAGDLESLPVLRGAFDVSIALNAIDMLPEPALLPRLQSQLLKKGGVAIQSCPYIWHEQVAKELRASLPAGIRDSARAVEWLYGQAGLAVEERVEHLPWLFFKHLRQLEIYSVHAFRARKA